MDAERAYHPSMPDPYRAFQPFQGSSGGAPSPLSLTLSLLHPAVEPGSDLTTYAVAKVRAVTSAPMTNRPVMLVALVLDVSGSMQGDPITQVVHSAKRLAEILDDRDQLGIVTFSDGADVVAPLVQLGQGRRDIIRKVGSIRTNGRTNIAGGLAQAALLFPQRQMGERQLVVLMSDGAPNVGPSTPDELGSAARLLKARDIAISTLGFGAEHNDAVLSAIADGGGGVINSSSIQRCRNRVSFERSGRSSIWLPNEMRSYSRHPSMSKSFECWILRRHLLAPEALN
jgi:uncharacterized protein YegL